MSNVIILMNDTLRRDHVGVYGAPTPWDRVGHTAQPFIHTRNLDRFAAESALFERFYSGSYPTVPCRYDCFAGRFGFPTRGWQPLEPHDVVLSEIVQRAGNEAMLIYDTPMLGNNSYNYTRGFTGYDFVRGQHDDRYNIDPIAPPLPAAPHKLRDAEALKLYLRNTAHRKGEADWMCGQTITRALNWLERNRTRENFVLWVDMWDPHEPFDAPDYDVARYSDPAFDGDRIIYPHYGRADYMTHAERNHVRAMYAGLVTCVDRWVGRLLEKLETLGLDRNTLVVYLSDHGHVFGDHNLQGKPGGLLGQLYEETIRVPLLIRHPKGVGAGKRVGGLAQHPDLLPTVLEFLDIKPPDGIHGKSLWPLIEERTERLREYAFSGRYSRIEVEGAPREDATAFDGGAGDDQAGEPITVTSEDWAYLYTPAGGRRELYDLRRDPRETQNLASAHPELVGRMHQAFLDFLTGAGASPGRVHLYREPQPKPTMHADVELYTVRDRNGKTFAFTTEALAASVLSSALASRSVEPIRFGALAEREPRALILFNYQSYWAEDLR